MAAAPNHISIDTVYQRVLALANKEQRGYITPQEFNLMANQAQEDMFEQYFYELNMQETKEQTLEPGFANMIELVHAKLKYFKGVTDMVHTTGVVGNGYWDYPAGVYRTGKMSYQNRMPRVVSGNEAFWLTGGGTTGGNAWHMRGLRNDPVLVELEQGFRLFSDLGEVVTQTAGDFRVETIQKPLPVKWGYVVVNEQALYDAGQTNDFELHESEETDLVIKILELSGIIIKKPDIVQTAAQEESQNANEEMK